MLVRICILVCATLLLASANPVPQDTVQAQISENDQLQESNITTEIPESESEAVEPDSDTEEPPNNNNDGDGTSDLSKAKNENGSGLKSNSGANESSSDGNKVEKNKTTNFEDDKSDNGSQTVSVTGEPSLKSKPLGDNDDETESETETTDSSYDNDNENESDTDDYKNMGGEEYENDDSSENDEGSDSVSNDSDNASDENPENDNTLSIVRSNGVILRVYIFSTYDEEVTCQEIKKKDTVLEKRCFVAPLLLPYLQGAHVSVFNKFVNGEDFICQEIVSYVKGPIQVLCASNEKFFFRELTALHPEFSYLGQIDINLPLY